jgi:hypothetical protein
MIVAGESRRTTTNANALGCALRRVIVLAVRGRGGKRHDDRQSHKNDGQNSYENTHFYIIALARGCAKENRKGMESAVNPGARLVVVSARRRGFVALWH